MSALMFFIGYALVVQIVVHCPLNAHPDFIQRLDPNQFTKRTVSVGHSLSCLPDQITDALLREGPIILAVYISPVAEGSALVRMRVSKTRKRVATR